MESAGEVVGDLGATIRTNPLWSVDVAIAVGCVIRFVIARR